MSAEISRLSSAGVRLRTDAQENRNRIVEVARDLFATRGLDVPMAAIARRAGVAVATLYRRFPTKESLVLAAFADQFAHCASIVDDALADPDPWRGFSTGVRRMCAMHAVDRGFSAAFLAAFPDAVDVDREHDEAVRGIAELVRRAKQSGALRPDFVPEDITMLLMASGGIVAATPEAALAVANRLVAYMLTAFRAENAGPLPPPAPLDLADLLPSAAGRVR
jgi:AcrR family transcriptional regulator